MVGNDIIDLHETKRSSNWERRGFVQKIFTAEEQFIINNSTNPFTTVWQLWSMKESAYKVFIQSGGVRFFNPTKMKCSLDSINEGRVKINQTTLKTNTIINSDYIFSTASIDNCNIDTRIFRLKNNNREFQSSFMHQQVLQEFAQSNLLNSLDLTLRKSKTGVPKLYYKDKLNDSFLSISHHGNYGAFSILK